MHPSPGQRAVSGRIYLESGLPIGGLTIRAYRRGFGGTAEPVGSTETAPDGGYRLTFDVRGEANLELRAVGPNEKEIPLTGVAFRVTSGDVLNLVAPPAVRPQETEFDRLRADVARHLDDRPLRDAQETGDRPDLTLLQENSGWDARLVALAASAERLAEAGKLPAAVVYGMLRAGLPDNPVALAAVDPAAVDRALAAAADGQVISLTPAARRAAVEAFRGFARATRMTSVAPGALSSHGQMLAAAGLSTKDAETFDAIYAGAAHRGDDISTVWKQATDAGLPADRIRTFGKLGYLTLNNAQLAVSLARNVNGGLGGALVARGLFRPDGWVRQLTDLADGDPTRLAALVPPAYGGDTTDAKVRAYAEDMARKVRIGYPTDVLAQRVAAKELPVAENGHVATFLRRAAGLGLAVGRTPVTAMVRDHGDQLLAGVPADRVEAVADGVRTLHRIYQITPSDEAMTVLLDNGFRGAYDVTAMSREKFLGRYGDAFTTRGEADLVYRKAQHVTITTYAFFGAAKQVDVPPPVFAVSGSDAGRDAARTELIRHFPTMEDLFGSLDYCACDHCRSVLSPAAYLVDLLHFLDPPADGWHDDMTAWPAAHEGAPYPFATAAAWQAYRDAWTAGHPGEPVPDTTLTPYQVLTGRRPDLPRLPLTCENTNTVMPYLDIVNEILEFAVVHGRLTAGAVRDTGPAVTEDLLAEPQYLLPAAYDTLRAAVYPLTLPFDLWRETVRRMLDHFDTPLWSVLEAFGRPGVDVERLGLTPAEFALLADAGVGATWPTRFGYRADEQARARTELSNAKTLADRLGVSYADLLALVKSAVVNPRLAAVAVLPALGIGFEDLLRYREVPGHAPFDAAERAAFEALLAPVGGPAALAALFGAADLRRIVVLADPSAGPGFDTTTLRYADGTAADEALFLTLNYLVRIWRRLGWSLTETDRALRAFLPAGPPLTAATLGPALASALRRLGQLDALSTLLGADRLDLLALWTDLDGPRYADLFLVPGTPAIDPVFTQPLGRYLEYLGGDGAYHPFTWDPTRPESAATGNVGLAAHAGTVQGALGVSADDIGRILAAAGTSLAAAPLDMATVSLLHRYAVLAGALGTPVADLIALRQLSGLDPFADTPAFVRAVLAVRDAGLAVPEVDYLLRHRFDPAGPYAVDSAPPLDLVRALDAEITRITTEHADPADPTALTDDRLRQEMALVLPSGVVDRFFGMWTGTLTDPSDRDFFAANLQEPVGFLDAADFDPLFTPPPDGATDEEIQAHQAARRQRLVSALLPFLRDRLIDRVVLATVGARYPDAPPLVAALLTGPDLLADRQAPGVALATTFRAAAERGLTATPSTVDGYVSVPTAGAYTFRVTVATAGTTATLRFDHLPEAVLQFTSAAAGETASAALDLRPGTDYHLVLTGDATLEVAGENLAMGPVERLTCHPAAAVERVRRAAVLLDKAVRLAAALGLGEPELRHLLTHPDDFAGLSLGDLPVTAAEDDPAQATALFRRLGRLAGLAALRDELGAGPADLVDVFAHARRAFPAGTGTADDLFTDVVTRVATLTRRDAATVRAAAARLGIVATSSTVDGVVRAEVPDLVNELGLRRLWTVLTLAGRIGVSPDVLGGVATGPIDAATARQLRDAVRARYDVDGWRTVARPIFDTLRQRRRDALVAWLLVRTGLDRVDQLFELFLVDPGTEPVVRTSRLRLAISSVQLFVQRCLLNLEPGVHPSVIDADVWAWVKRYRVWEANRKIFLWPENWLEPEFRDDKSHLFRELEGTLLQGDVTDDLAEEAFFGYLRGLEPLARLDIRALYLEQGDDPSSNTLHVVGRTFAAPHRYYYRTYTDGAWSAWVPVTAEIEGDHLVLVVWRDRPHLFWTTFVEKTDRGYDNRTPEELSTVPVGELATPRRIDIHLHWAEFNRGEWSDRRSAGPNTPMSTTVPYWWEPDQERAHTTFDGDALLVHLSGVIDLAFRVWGPNSPPEFDEAVDPPPLAYAGMYNDGLDYRSETTLTVVYTDRITTVDGRTTEHDTFKPILGQNTDYVLRMPANELAGIDPEIASLISPLFYQDRTATFYVEPALTEVTIDRWDDWVVASTTTRPDLDLTTHFDDLDLTSHVPVEVDDPVPFDPISPVAKYSINPPVDWVTRPGSTVTYNGTPVRGWDTEVRP